MLRIRAATEEARMGVSAEALGATAPEWTAESKGEAVPRALSASARKLFLSWTAVFWAASSATR